MLYDTACPNDEILMDFLEHRLTGNALQEVERHLARCADCREQVAECAELLCTSIAEDTTPVPQGVTQRAVDTVLGLENKSLFDKLIHSTRRQISKSKSALERLTWQPVSAAVALRGQAETLNPEVIRRKKQFGHLRVDIEIEKSDADQALIRVSGSSLQADTTPVRVALFSQDREVASALLGDAPIIFEEIPLGIYALVFVKQNKDMGRYAFEIADQP